VHLAYIANGLANVGPKSLLLMHRIPLLFLVLLFCTCAPSPTDNTESSADPWLENFTKPAENPILTADPTFTFLDPLADTIVRWQRADVFNPGAITDGDSVYLFFRAEDNPRAILGGRTSRIGLAVSADGINFRREPLPVLYPDDDVNREFEQGGGCEDPRVVEMPDGGYLMHYTAWNQDVARLCVATSPDMRQWTKHGPVFQDAYGGKFHNTWSKSGSVVCELTEDGRMVARQINGKYWMYWGDAVVGLAHSEDLLDWTPVLNPDSTLFDPLPRRRGKFDSGLSEPGPPALITPRGILVLYNGKNAEVDSLRSMEIGPGAYCGGQALFSLEDPTELLLRQDTPYIKPSLPHEMTGQYASGTTFTEALVRFKDKWFLYYGTADSMVGVAVSEDAP
jgi:predicted GH43/DUF377 family glycosyl hydrolase